MVIKDRRRTQRKSNGGEKTKREGKRGVFIVTLVSSEREKSRIEGKKRVSM
jgi:hypothetical protein